VAWIKSHDEIGEHPKTLILAEELKVPIAHAVGLLHLLWHFTLRYSWRKGDLTSFGDAAIARASKWDGEPIVFIKALQKSRFLDEYKIHDWLDFSGRLIKDRIHYEKRTHYVRKPSVTRTDHVDKSRVDKIREDKKSPNPLSPTAGSTPGNGRTTANGTAKTPEDKAREAFRQNQPKPWNYDVPDDEVLGPEEFAKMKAGLSAPAALPQPEEPMEVAIGGPDDDVF